MEEKVRAYGRSFEKEREKDPSLTFGKYYVQVVKQKIAETGSHTTLGPNVVGAEDWRRAGRKTFDALVEKGGVTGDSVVVDYGCGSLRLGQHFIRLLRPGCYMGLDVSNDFIAMGLDLMEASELEEKQPKFGQIDDDASVATARDMSPDLVFAHGVHFHIHPDELPRFYSNIEAIAHKPGARVVINTQISSKPLRYHSRGWAWPQEEVEQAMARFELKEVYNRGDYNEKVGMQTCFLKFERK